HFTQDDIWETVTNFAALSVEEAREKYDLGKDSKDWKVELAQQDLKKDEISKSKISSILYRPFDLRFTYYTGNSGGFHCRARGEVMNNMVAGENLGLVATRQVTSLNFCHINVSDSLIELKVGSHDRNSQLFPLYLYPKDNPTLFDRPPTNALGGRSHNLAPEFIAELSTRLKITFIADGKGDRETTFGPEDIFNYMYAVFHSPTYRDRYAEFLKTDFPRLPLTSNIDLFWELGAKGDRLVNLHLMKATAAEIASYPETGDNKIDKVRYTPPKDDTPGKVWINKNQYFEGIPPQVWNFYIGGYQVCQKWLKDRKGRKLDYDAIACYQNIVVALAETIVLMEEIDDIIKKNDGFPLK
ncbi:MAG: DNA methyltransferase, partial [Okeania sp. SIO2H7]|nr:DNA methyltransferase [Okeania sp. SIO2H7]